MGKAVFAGDEGPRMPTTDRVRPKALRARIMDASEAVDRLVPERGSIAFSCMGGSSLAKEIPEALGRAAASGRRYELTLLTGGATTERFEAAMARVGVRRRFPYLSAPARRAANDGSTEFFDPRIGEFPDLVRRCVFTEGRPIDVAVIEATAIDDHGRVVPSLSVDALPAFVEASRHILIEVNERKPDLTGLHDVYRVRPGVPIPIHRVRDRVGRPYVVVPPSKIAGIVVTDRAEEPSAAYSRALPEDRRTADTVAAFLETELGSWPEGEPFALQLGAGPMASALLDALPLRNLDIWTEGIPARWAEAVGDKVRGISTTAMYLLPGDERVLPEALGDVDRLRRGIVLRPYEVSNSLEVIARLNVVTIQQALEVDLFGGANTSHIGRRIHNGVGGSPDFDRAARLVVVVMPSTASEGRYSRIVPFVSSPDIPRQDVDVVVTDQGIADLRGMSARERARAILDRCVHPSFRDRLETYYRAALARGGHLPMDREAALRFQDEA